jgi:Flp pilus assembly protein TadD
MSDWHEAEDLVERAQAHFEAGRFERAADHLRRAIAMDPSHFEWHFNLGVSLEATGQHALAAAAFERASTLGPDDPHAAMLAGVNLLHADRALDAIRWFEAAHHLDRDNPDSLVHRINAYARLGQHEQAEVMFYLALQLNPGFAPAHGVMGRVLADQGQFERAIPCLREAARLEPDAPGVYADLARAYAATGRHERARQLYFKELRLDPGNREALLELGQLLARLNRPGEASEKFRRVLELEPHDPQARHHLAILAMNDRRLDEAIAEFEVLTRLESAGLGARRRLAECLLSRGRAGDAAAASRHLQGEIERYQEDPDGFAGEDLADLAALLLDAKQSALAADLYKDLGRRRPDDAEIMHLWAVALFDAGRRDEGRAIARRVLALRPGHAPSLHNLALSCLQDGQWRRAKYWATLARRADPDDVSLRRLRLVMLAYGVKRLGFFARRFKSRWVG